MHIAVIITTRSFIQINWLKPETLTLVFTPTFHQTAPPQTRSWSAPEHCPLSGSNPHPILKGKQAPYASPESQPDAHNLNPRLGGHMTKKSYGLDWIACHCLASLSSGNPIQPENKFPQWHLLNAL